MLFYRLAAALFVALSYFPDVWAQAGGPACARLLTPPATTEEKLAVHYVPGWFDLNAEGRNAGPPAATDAQIEDALEALPGRRRSATSLRETQKSGTPLNQAIFLTHQAYSLQPATAQLLRGGSLPPEIPRVALVSAAFAVHDAALAEEVDRFLVSRNGELREPFDVREAFVVGGFGQFCLSRTVFDLIQAASSGWIKITFLTEFVYMGNGKTLAEVLRHTPLGATGRYVLLNLLPRMRFGARPTVEAHFNADGAIEMEWRVAPSIAAPITFKIVLDSRR